MKKPKYLVLIFLIPILTNCGRKRIHMISENSGLILPNKYKVIRNDSIHSGFAGEAYKINVVLEFNDQDFKDLILHIDSLSHVSDLWEYNKYDSTFEYYNQIDSCTLELIFIKKQEKTLWFILGHV